MKRPIWTRLVSLTLSMAFLMALAAPALAAETASTMQLSKTEGTVTLTSSAGKSMSLRDEMRLYNGYTLNTATKSYAWVTLDSSKLCKLDASSKVEVRKSGSKLELLVHSGKVFFNVTEPLSSNESLNIRTSTSIMGIRGTCGWVEVQDQQTTRLTVLEGSVECAVFDPDSGQSKTDTIQAGQAAELVVTPEDEEKKCDIIYDALNADEVCGFVLAELAADEALADRVQDATQMELPIDGAEDRLEQDEKDQEKLQAEIDAAREAQDQEAGGASAVVPAGEDTVVPATPEPSPSKAPDASGSSGSSGSSSSTSTSTTYTVTFDANGGAFGEDITTQTATVSSGEVYDLASKAPTPSTAPSSDKVFVGWGLTKTANTAETSVTVNQNVTLYAVWYTKVDASISIDELNAALETGNVKITAESSATLSLGRNNTLSISGDRVLITASNVTVENTGGTIEVNGTMTVEGVLTNSGTITVNGTMNVTGETKNDGTITVTSATSFHATGPITNSESGSLCAEEDGFIEAKGGITNSGSVEITDRGKLTVKNTLANSARVTVLGDGSLSVTDILENDKNGFVAAPGIGALAVTGSINNTGYLVDGTTLKIGSGIETIENALAGEEYKIDITEVVLAEGVSTVGERAFEGFAALTTVTIPSTVTSIGESAFSGCEVLKSVSLPADIKTISASTFSGCTGLTSVSLPASITSIDRTAFSECSALANVTIIGSGKMKDYTDDAPAPWSDLLAGGSAEGINLTIGEEITSIGAYAFKGDYTTKNNLKAVTFPAGVTTIGDYAFNSSGLTGKLVLPDSVTSVGNYAFGNTALTSASVPAGVKTLDSFAFGQYDSNGTNIKIYYQGTSEQWGNDGMTFPNNDPASRVNTCVYIRENSADGNATWYNMNNYTGTLTITGTGAMATYTSENPAPWSADTVSSVVIEDGVTSVGANAFSGCESLSSVSLPADITSIGTDAFTGCEILTDLTVTGSGKIKDYTYNDPAPWSDLLAGGSEEGLNLTIGEGITSIGDCAFKGDYTNKNNLKAVTFPATVTAIGDYAFNNSGLTGKLELPEGVETVGARAFAGTKLTYARVPDSVTSIGNSAFSGCSGLTSINIPNDVTEIGESMFSGCSSLTDLTLPSGVTKIGTSAFSGCSGLTTLTLPSTVISIGDNAFQNCSGLTSINIPSNVDTIGGYTFSGCTALTSVDFASNSQLATIGDNAFSGCTTLTTLTLPAGVTKIGQSVFNGCTGLTSLTLPASITSIGTDAFSGCEALKTITYLGTTDTWAQITGTANLAGKTLTIGDTGYLIQTDGTLGEGMVAGD